jgi:hypothetical protein
MSDGYVEPVTLVTLKFAGKRAGLEIHTREPDADTWEEDIAPLLQDTGKPMKFVDLFIRHLDSWNLKLDNGSSVPCTRKGFMSHNIRFVNDVLTAWINNGILVLPEEESPSEVELEEPEVDPFEGQSVPTVDMTDFEPPQPKAEAHEQS